jgi:cardiolipin synthase
MQASRISRHGAIQIILAGLLTQCGTVPSKQGRLTETPASPISKLSEVRHLVRSTAVAAVKKPVTTVRVGTIMLWQRAYVFARSLLPAPHWTDSASHGIRPGSEEFEALLDRKGFRPRTCGKLDLCIDGPGYFPPFLEAVKSAREKVDVQTYIFDNDDQAVEVADVLRAKSTEVPVRVFFDALGSSFAGTIPPKTPPPPGYRRPKNMKSYLEEGSRVKVRGTINPLFYSDHTKLQLIDGKVAFLGGMNMGREYRSEWHDLMVRLEGPVVQKLQRIFDRTWKEAPWWHDWNVPGWFARDRDRHGSLRGAPECPPGLQPMRLLRTDSLHDDRDILRATILAIRGAARRVWIETPYYAADDITAELRAAVRRGVDVRVIIPGESDSNIMTATNEVTAAELLRIGAKVFKYQGVTHLKAMICDDWALLGSGNCDTLSLRINRELDVAVNDRETVQRIADAVFRQDFLKSREVSYDMLDEGFGLAKFLGDQL